MKDFMMIKLIVSVLALTGIVGASIDTFSLFDEALSIIIVTVFGFWYADREHIPTQKELGILREARFLAVGWA